MPNERPMSYSERAALKRRDANFNAAVVGMLLLIVAGVVVWFALSFADKRSASQADKSGSSKGRGVQVGQSKLPDLRIGDSVVIGDVEVKVFNASVSSFYSISPAGFRNIHQPEFVVELKFKNNNPNRVAEFGSQDDSFSLEDDVGNSYRMIGAKTEAGSRSIIEDHIERGQVRYVRSDDVGKGDFLAFDRPVPGASKLTLNLDATKYGGSGSIRVVMSRSDWEKKPEPAKVHPGFPR